MRIGAAFASSSSTTHPSELRWSRRHIELELSTGASCQYFLDGSCTNAAALYRPMRQLRQLPIVRIFYIGKVAEIHRTC